MKTSIAFILFFLNICNFSSAQTWKLIFEDNFNGSSFNTDNWSYCTRGKAIWTMYLSESTETVNVVNGNLVVNAIKNNNLETDSSPYLTGGIKSKTKFSFLYGKIEVRAKFKSGQGAWPAIWLMPENNTYGVWPKCGEIDIMEKVNLNPYVHQAVHSDFTDILNNKTNPPQSKDKVYIVNNDYNIYGLEWYPEKLDFLVNGVVTFTYPRLTPITWSQWPFDTPFYIILNQAAGGSWAGKITDSDLPFQMQVDWVKVYQQNSTATENTMTTKIKILRNGNTVNISNIEKNSLVSVFDYTGKLVFQSISNHSNLNLNVIKGFIIIKIQDSSGVVYSQKI